jgi:ABC-2 type transport system permease protein
MPAVLLSGFAFPIASMPQPVQYITYLNPLRYFVTIIRALFLKGVGLKILLPEIIPLAAIGISVLTLASLRFRKRVG